MIKMGFQCDTYKQSQAYWIYLKEEQPDLDNILQFKTIF